MVSYIRHDLEFILKQIKIAEAHAAGQPLYGEGGLIPVFSTPGARKTPLLGLSAASLLPPMRRPFLAP